MLFESVKGAFLVFILIVAVCTVFVILYGRPQ